MSKEELINVIRELYRLCYVENGEEDIRFILTQVIKKIGK